MTFDQWIDAVNLHVRARLGDAVKTEELSWDSAIWKSARGTAVASLSDDGVTAHVFFDGGDKLAMGLDAPEAMPDALSRTIAEHLGAV